jgi:hypothetical protein
VKKEPNILGETPVSETEQEGKQVLLSVVTHDRGKVSLTDEL